eukprot:77089-Chlamydomonas_euryale.AAC.1
MWALMWEPRVRCPASHTGHSVTFHTARGQHFLRASCPSSHTCVILCASNWLHFAHSNRATHSACPLPFSSHLRHTLSAGARDAVALGSAERPAGLCGAAAAGPGRARQAGG